MRSPNRKQTAAAADLRSMVHDDEDAADRQSGVTRISRAANESNGVAHAMVDALEDILKWERASERSLRAAPASSPDPTT